LPGEDFKVNMKTRTGKYVEEQAEDEKHCCGARRLRSRIEEEVKEEKREYENRRLRKEERETNLSQNCPRLSLRNGKRIGRRQGKK